MKSWAVPCGHISAAIRSSRCVQARGSAPSELANRPNERADCYDNDNQSCQFPIPGFPVHGILIVLNLAVPQSGRSRSANLGSLVFLRVGVVECTAQGLCELHRIVVRPKVHVEEARYVIQCMAMQSYCLNAVVLQNLQNGSNLFPRQREVSGNGGFPIASWLEVDRDAHSHRWRRIQSPLP